MKQKGYDLDRIGYIWRLNKGDISFDEYLRKRGLKKNDKMWELEYIVNDNPLLLDEFLSNISIGLRCISMKTLFNLTYKEIENFIDFRKSTIGYFISDNMMLNKNSSMALQRNTSIELIYDLAIIFDLPFRYLADTYTKYEMMHEFAEYKTRKIKESTLNEIIDEIYIQLKSGDNNKRNIYGVKILNQFFEAGEKKFLYSRIDIRKDYFTIEMHLENDANIYTPELLKLENSIKIKHAIYIRRAFLRDNKKLIILIQLNDLVKPNIAYLHEEFLWRKVLYQLKKETLKKLKEESFSEQLKKSPT